MLMLMLMLLLLLMMIIIVLEANRRRKYSNDTAQQGRTESLQYPLWQTLYSPFVTLVHSSQPAGISCMLVFGEGEKPSKQRREPTKTKPTLTYMCSDKLTGDFFPLANFSIRKKKCK